MKKLLFNIFILLLASLFYTKNINAQIIINSGGASTVTTDSTLTGTGSVGVPLN